MRSYEDLTVYQDAYALTLELYPAVRKFPREERYELGAQVRTSAVSILSNLAEGAGRATDGEHANSVSIASGSAAELECQIKLSRDLGFMPRDEADAHLASIASIRRRLHRLYEALKHPRRRTPAKRSAT